MRKKIKHLITQPPNSYYAILINPAQLLEMTRQFAPADRKQKKKKTRKDKRKEKGDSA